jgi:hypothetical protein
VEWCTVAVERLTPIGPTQAGQHASARCTAHRSPIRSERDQVLPSIQRAIASRPPRFLLDHNSPGFDAALLARWSPVRSHAGGLLSIAGLNIARSRIRSCSCGEIRMAPISLSLRVAFAHEARVDFFVDAPRFAAINCADLTPPQTTARSRGQAWKHLNNVPKPFRR